MSTPTEQENLTNSSDPQEQDSGAAEVKSDAQASDASADDGKSGTKGTEQHLSDVDVKFLRAFRNLTADEDKLEEAGTRITLRSILGGDILSGEWFQKQIWYILMVVVMIIFYTSNRYACQQEILTTKQLNDTLLDRRYKALTRSAQLKQSTRRSYIEETLADSTIQTSVTPPFTIIREEE